MNELICTCIFVPTKKRLEEWFLRQQQLFSNDDDNNNYSTYFLSLISVFRVQCPVYEQIERPNPIELKLLMSPVKLLFGRKGETIVWKYFAYEEDNDNKI